MNKKILIKLKLVARLGMMGFMFLALFQLGQFYEKEHVADESPWTFFTEDKVFQYDINDGVPDNIVKSVNGYNQIVSTIWKALGFSFLIMFLDYFVDKKNHFITTIKNRLNKNKNKVEEDDGNDEED